MKEQETKGAQRSQSATFCPPSEDITATRRGVIFFRVGGVEEIEEVRDDKDGDDGGGDDVREDSLEGDGERHGETFEGDDDLREGSFEGAELAEVGVGGETRG